MFYDDLSALNIPLPEDIASLKGHGDYARLKRVLKLRIDDPSLPEALRTRLRLEARMIERIPREYPYGFDEALNMLQAEL